MLFNAIREEIESRLLENRPDKMRRAAAILQAFARLISVAVVNLNVHIPLEDLALIAVRQLQVLISSRSRPSSVATDLLIAAAEATATTGGAVM